MSRTLAELIELCASAISSEHGGPPELDQISTGLVRDAFSFGEGDVSEEDLWTLCSGCPHDEDGLDLRDCDICKILVEDYPLLDAMFAGQLAGDEFMETERARIVAEKTRQ